MSVKTLKDPVYGYIEIDSGIMSEIVDSSTFQRLRDIRQTSYAPLYHASFHNRFAHSLGVYHLAKIAINSLEYNNISINADRKSDFLLACLLHDVGHSPFSHTGEEFYRQNDIDTDLKTLINSHTFTTPSNRAAPHEVMSAIVAIKKFKEHMRDPEFFSRCITGYKYPSELQALDNILISLLNSEFIDVDRLDYIIRDSFATGFQSVSIDYVRFLKGLNCVENQLVYNKSSLSVIENIIYAHDAERKWIQAHPVIKYEHHLLTYAIKQCVSRYTDLFSYDAVSDEGCDIGSGKVRLLTDNDIIALMKNEFFNDDKIKEYFSRKNRKHPVWKSEAEYNVLFLHNLGDNKLNELEDIFEQLSKIPINETSYTNAAHEIEQLKDKEEEIAKVSLNGQTKLHKWLSVFKTYATENSIEFDFELLQVKKFNSNFAKENLSKLLIKFDNKISNKPVALGKASNILKSEDGRKHFYYLYHKNHREINVGNLASYISQQLFL